MVIEYKHSMNNAHMTWPIRLARGFFAFLVPLILLAISISRQWLGEPLWLDIAFAVLLASMVGFYTNFIAIKMLFRPQNPTIFGRQGLIPRKQSELADAMGSGISEHFFSADELLNYIEQEGLLHKLSASMKSSLTELLSRPDTQAKISHWLSEQIDRHSAQINQFMVSSIDEEFTNSLTSQADLPAMAHKLGQYIEAQIESGEIDVEQVVDKFAEVAAENIPDLARWLHQQFEDYNQTQGVIKRNFISFLKWSNDIDEQALREQLYRLISTMEFRSGVYQVSERMVRSVSEYMHTSEGQVHLKHANYALNQYLIEQTRDHGIPLLVKRIQNYLAEPDSWVGINQFLSKAIDALEVNLEEHLRSQKFREQMRDWLPRILEQFNIQRFISQKVRTLDTQRLEELVLSASHQHLTLIEILGGVLGGFAGIALYSVPLFLALVGALLVGLGVEQLLTSKQNAPSKSLDKPAQDDAPYP